MIIRLDLMLSVDFEPDNIFDPVTLIESITKHLRGMKVSGKSTKMEIKDVGIMGSGLPVEWDEQP